MRRQHPRAFVDAVERDPPRRDVGAQRDLDGEACLADAAGADDGDEPIVCERRGDAVELGGAAHEARQRAADGGTPGRTGHQRRVVPQDRALERRQRRSGVEPQLFDECLAGLLVCSERVGLPSAAIERKHQLLAQTLAQRIASDEGA